MFDTLLDRRWYFIYPWTSRLAALLDRVRGRRRISVPPMSDAWLRQLDVDYPKHGDGNG